MVNWYSKGQADYLAPNFHMAFYIDHDGYDEGDFDSQFLETHGETSDPFMAFGIDTGPVTWTYGQQQVEIGLLKSHRIKIDMSGVFIWSGPGQDDWDLLTGGAHALDAHSDVVIDAPVDNELLAWDNGSSRWINQTAAEAGLSATGHNHAHNDLTGLNDGTSYEHITQGQKDLLHSIYTLEEHNNDYHNPNYKVDFSENSAFNKNFGTLGTEVCVGNDSRLSDSRTPTAHVISPASGPHTGTLPWGDLSKTGSNLTDLVTRQHAGLTDVTESQHHVKYTNAEAVQAVEDAGLALSDTKVITSQDADLTFTFGRGSIYSAYEDHAAFAHRDKANVQNYALKQKSDGSTYLNSALGADLFFAVENTIVANWKSAGLQMVEANARINEFSTDGSLGGDSDTALPTEKAVKTYVDGIVHTRLHSITDILDHSASNHKIFYSDGSAHIIELALGDDGDVLTSTGTTSAPAFEVPTGGGDTKEVSLQHVEDTGLVLSSGIVITSADENLSFTFGRTLIDARLNNYMVLSHRLMTTTANYSIRQNSVGETRVNSASGQLNLCIGGVIKANISASGLQVGSGARITEFDTTPLANSDTKVPTNTTVIEYVATQVHAEGHILATTGPHTGTLPWGDLSKTGSNLTDLVTRQHAGLTDVTTAQHHTKYTNAEAVAAVLADDAYLKLVGDTMGGDIDMGLNSLKFTRGAGGYLKISHVDTDADNVIIDQITDGLLYIRGFHGIYFATWDGGLADRMFLSPTALTMSVPIAMGTNKITGVGNGVDPQDAMAFGQKYTLEQHNNDFHSTNYHTESDGTGVVTIHSDITSAGSGIIITAGERNALHPQLTNLTELATRNHNDLLNLNAGDNYEHITQTQKNLLAHLDQDVKIGSEPSFGALTLTSALTLGGDIAVGGLVDSVDIAAFKTAFDALSIINMPTAVNNWKVFCTNGAGVMTEIATGAAATVLTGNGVGAAPSFQAGGGGGGESLDETFDIGKIIDGANSLVNAVQIGEATDKIKIWHDGTNAYIDYGAGQPIFNCVGGFYHLRYNGASMYYFGNSKIAVYNNKARNIGSLTYAFDNVYADDFVNRGVKFIEKEGLFERFKNMKIKPHPSLKNSVGDAEVDNNFLISELTGKDRHIKQFKRKFVDKVAKKRKISEEEAEVICKSYTKEEDVPEDIQEFYFENPDDVEEQDYGNSIGQWCIVNSIVLQELITKNEALEERINKLEEK